MIIVEKSDHKYYFNMSKNVFHVIRDCSSVISKYYTFFL